MNESATNPNAASAADVREDLRAVQPRLWLWVAGTLLWIAVGIAGVFLYQSHQREIAARWEHPANAANFASPGETTVVEKQPVGAWDPAGIEEFEFEECRGGMVSRQDLAGKPWVVSFIFTRCASTCPMIMRSMWELERDLDDVDMRFVSLTVDPAFDTVEVLKKEAENFEAEEGRWLFLTGEQADIYHLIWSSFKMPVKEITGPQRQPGFQVMHSNNIMLVDAEGVVVGKYDGTQGEQMAKLRRRIREMVSAETKASK